MDNKELNAKALRDELWDNLLKVKSKEITHEIANATNAAGRELLRSFALEQKIYSMINEKPSKTLLGFFEIEPV